MNAVLDAPARRPIRELPDELISQIAAGVERVVHQLAHDRGRALHHLAGGNLAHQRIGQLTDGAARRANNN